MCLICRHDSDNGLEIDALWIMKFLIVSFLNRINNEVDMIFSVMLMNIFTISMLRGICFIELDLDNEEYDDGGGGGIKY
jgi:hypothetical protein